MSLALRAARRRPVELLTKGPLVSGSTALAQGGIAAALSPDDARARHVADTIAAGAGLCDPGVVAHVCGMAPARVRDLVRLGVDFDRDEDGRLHLAREAAHSCARVAHAGGDATGARIADALARRVMADEGIVVREGWRATEIVVRHGAACGVLATDPDGVEHSIHGRAVVLATGGLGGAFLRTTNPAGATADGMAMAWRAGAVLIDLELIQFHPTALAVSADDGGRLPLISEALRGAGGVLRDAHGRRFMEDVHPSGELAPRDVVARAIARRSASGPVTLDLPGIGPGEAARRFPTAARACAEHALLLGRDPVPVAPAAHFSMGGVMTDAAGRTGVPGLYAIGEVASTGMHGANRLASNAMLEGAAMAAACARSLDEPMAWPADPLTATPPASRGAAPATATSTREIRGVMSEAMGVERDEEGLARAQRALQGVDASALDQDGRSLLVVAGLAVAAARLRTESRGAHLRADHPSPRGSWEQRICWHGHQPRTVSVRSEAPLVRSAA